MPETSRTMKPDVEAIARIVHAAIRAYQLALGEAAAARWEEAEPWQRESTIEGVKFRLDHPGAPISAQHDQWMAEKQAAGWRYGAVKDAQKKTHPALVPFTELSETERRKDALFQAVIDALTKRI